MSNSYQAPPKNELDHPRLALKGKKHANGKTLPNLKVALLDNVARLRCYTGIEGEKSISAKLDPRDIEGIVEIIKTKVIPNREDHKFKIEQMSLWIGGSKRDTPGVVSTIMVGRHNGQAFISLFGFNTPKIAFPFTYGDMLKIYGTDGELLDPVDESNICAMAWCRSILGMVYPATVKNYKHPESNFNKPQGGGGYNGGGQNKNYNGGGNKPQGGSPANDFDDDFAF